MFVPYIHVHRDWRQERIRDPGQALLANMGYVWCCHRALLVPLQLVFGRSGTPTMSHRPTKLYFPPSVRWTDIATGEKDEWDRWQKPWGGGAHTEKKGKLDQQNITQLMSCVQFEALGFRHPETLFMNIAHQLSNTMKPYLLINNSIWKQKCSKAANKVLERNSHQL